MFLFRVAILLAAMAAQTENEMTRPSAASDPIDRALHQMYNADFEGGQAIITAELRKNPEDPFLHALRATGLLFSEFDRLKILELDFFADDGSLTDRKRLKPDPLVGAEFFRATGEARRLASKRLAVDPNDTNALYALFVAVGVETDYVLLVEKKYIRSYSLAKEGQKYAAKLLAMNPPVYDAYLNSGMMEYVVGNLNFVFRWFVHFDQIKGNKQKAIEHLKLVIDHGRYYSPYAKLLLSVIYLREKKPDQALVLLTELERDFPSNPLVRKEVMRIKAQSKQGKSGK
jgi:hypothetical protein